MTEKSKEEDNHRTALCLCARHCGVLVCYSCDLVLLPFSFPFIFVYSLPLSSATPITLKHYQTSKSPL